MGDGREPAGVCSQIGKAREGLQGALANTFSLPVSPLLPPLKVDFQTLLSSWVRKAPARTLHRHEGAVLPTVLSPSRSCGGATELGLDSAFSQSLWRSAVTLTGTPGRHLTKSASRQQFQKGSVSI